MSILTRFRAVPTGSAPVESEATLLRREIEHTKADLELALKNFEQVVDPALIDCCIYEAQAAQLRYQVLLKQAKQFGF